MRLRFHCGKCPAHIDWTWTPDKGEHLACPRCNRDIALRAADALSNDGSLDRCPVCESREMYFRKDFPQGLGVSVVVIAAVASFWLLKSHWFASWAVLLIAVAIDVLLYRFVGFVTCCYRCKAEFRDVARNQAHGGFDLATAEKYS